MFDVSILSWIRAEYEQKFILYKVKSKLIKFLMIFMFLRLNLYAGKTKRRGARRNIVSSYFVFGYKFSVFAQKTNYRCRLPQPSQEGCVLTKACYNFYTFRPYDFARFMKQPHALSPQTLLVPSDDRVDVLRVRKTKLLVISGPLQGKEFMVDQDVFTLGSGSQNDLQLADPAISKRHCEIRIDQNGYSILDLDSTNGTYVQGIRVTQAFLHPGAEIQLGKTRLIFCPLQDKQEVPLSQNTSFGEVIGQSVSMRRIFHIVETYAPTDATVMITGETGTGKEILAEEIHKHSPRRNKPFIVIDCAALARDLIESELFGHMKGAFTGATSDRAGAFEHADGGTVFLDEIGDLSPELQPKLLRVLEKREIRRIGSNTPKRIDVRILCATNRRMDTEVNEGRFREDLFYRLSVVPIELPPLRRRREDIPLLIEKFVKSFHGADAATEIEDFAGTMEILKRHEWPGNVRELRNLVELAFYSTQRPIRLSAFLSFSQFAPPPVAAPKETAPAITADRPFKDAKGDLISDFEQKYIKDLLDRNDGNVSRSAREAGIERAYLQRLIRKYGLRSKEES